MAEEGKLQKLIIESYEAVERTGTPLGTFTVMFNPTTFNQKYEVEYYVKAAKAGPTTPVFARKKPQEYDFEFTLDGTGVSETALSISTKRKNESNPLHVGDKVDEFWEICGRLNGDIHRPPYLRIKWGSFVLDVVLKSADVTYTLFKKDGTPLRAKITATFDENIKDDEQEARDAKSSPDLSHVRTVIQGDTLTLMTRNIYGNSNALYLEVAKFNKLNNFRKLRSGSQLIFPPIDKTTK